MKVDLSQLADRVEMQSGLVFEPIRLLSKVFTTISDSHHLEIVNAVLKYDEKDFKRHNITVEKNQQKSADPGADFDLH